MGDSSADHAVSKSASGYETQDSGASSSELIPQSVDQKPNIVADGSTSTEENIVTIDYRTGIKSADKKETLDEYSYIHRNNFTSEIFKIEVGNLPFFMTPSDFKKVLTKRLGLQPHKIKMFKISRSQFAFVTFRNEESRDSAIKALDGYRYKQTIFKAGLAKPRADPVQKAKKRCAEECGNASPKKKSMLDIIIPWHSLNYEEQLRRKQEYIEKLLIKLDVDLSRQQNKDFNDTVRALKKVTGRKTICNICEICRSPRTEHYRNKNEFTPGRDGNGAIVVGFRMSSYKKGSIEVGGVTETMKHVPPLAVKVARLFEEFLRACGDSRPPYNAEEEKGYWRQLTVRTSERNQCMAILIMHPQNLSPQEIQEDIKKLKVLYETKLKSTVTSFYFQLFDKKGNDYPFELLGGNTVIEEDLLGLTFEISPPSFFQVNTKGAETLYDRVANLANISKNTTVLDLFCGTGSIGLSLASRAKRIIGAEIVPEAVTNAKKVATRHGITNAEFITGKAEDVLSLALSKLGNEEHTIAIVDPPRQGVHNRVVKLLRSNPNISSVVYIACNPNAAMQNILDFCKASSNSYRGEPFIPTNAQPVDMFPHTPHTELIITMKRLDLVKLEIEELIKANEALKPNVLDEF
ncbi:tRNA (uracil-5-)-methyltransferase homolog A-like isoform X1 [Varroa jacobsoni]|uniref:tRNA (uracil-5-)-methyltransferase homolog A-like isoform X1 n=1 Tax=Varroa jacobsoni TaxID=62625 RepID=UPI000BF3793D|nr:tRNA (uracil-5-)-methyltransferase homolog A-like isoform X1 [Varroa jacobsoni]XP_022706179.1 tRNA (uracil-5-)-methyltransferase homolog A-like isoform X1 [Varroa jacobsoni]